MATDVTAYSQWTAGLGDLLRALRPKKVPSAGSDLHYAADRHSLWFLIRPGHKNSTWAYRACFDPLGLLELVDGPEAGDGRWVFNLRGGLGEFRIELARPTPEIIRSTTWWTPQVDTRLQAMPRDLYLLDGDLQPITEARVLGRQQGYAAPFLFFVQDRPSGVSGLYLQQLTGLNDYFEASHADAREVVGGEAPELGFALPIGDQALPAKRSLCISDVFLRPWDSVPPDETAATQWFLDAVADIYPLLDRPETQPFDWPATAGRTMRSLSATGCRKSIAGQTYFNSYLGSDRKPPESMVQFALLVPLLEWETWRGRPHPLSKKLIRALPTFFDPAIGSVVRWLPGEEFTGEQPPSEEEDPSTIDSWYLYHVLLNLARLTQLGIPEAEQLFRDSLPYGIRVAHHFQYRWPVFFRMRSLAIVKAETAPGAGGEQDVPGLYVKLMMMAHELWGEDQYLEEAKTAAAYLRGLGFDLLYQTNNTMFSADGLLRLWKVTGNREYLELSESCLANVIARMWLWQCRYGHARHYNTFLGVAPLQDADYVAAYEEAESFAAALAYLKIVGDHGRASIRLLLGEYMKYLLERGRYYYPSELPPEVVSDQPKEGRIQRNLSIPLEDLRTGWQQSGQVGQEIYGAASALVLTAQAYLRQPSVPFQILSEYPAIHSDYKSDRRGSGELHARLSGDERLTCRLRLEAKRGRLPRVELFVGDEDRPRVASGKRSSLSREYTLPGGSDVRIVWRRESIKKPS